jgi:hypothetical protein
MNARPFVITLLCSAVAAGAFFSGCSDDTETTDGEEGPDISDVVFDMEGGDEALIEVLRVAPTQDAANAAVIDAPASGMMVPAATPFTFRWRANASAQLDVGSSRQPTRLGFRFEPAPAKRPVRDLLELALGGVRSAHAHGPAVNGKAYFLVLATDADPKLLRVFTQANEYTPAADAWSRVAAAGGTITATVVSADMEANRVVQGGGPWISAPVTFTVTAQ